MTLIPASAAIMETYLDFGDGAEYAKTHLPEVAGLSGIEPHWEGTRLYFLTESIKPKIKSPIRPCVMLLFSNPHPVSVKTGLFMSEKHSRKFWGILSGGKQLDVSHSFNWDNDDSIHKTVSLFLNGDYGGPLLFFECFYQIPSNSPKDLRKLFGPGTGDFERYLLRPSIKRISEILTDNNIKVVLVFTSETFESIVGKRGISKDSRQTLCLAVKNALTTGDGRLFWYYVDKHELRKPVPDIKHMCIAIKVMDTRMKNAWKIGGRPTFSHVLDYALQYATKVS